MPSLRRTVALPQVHGVAVMIGQNLHFDVPRMLDVFFQINAAVAERRFGLGRRLLQGALQRQVVEGHAHPAPPPPAVALIKHRKTDLVRKPHRFLLAGDQSVAAGHHRHVGVARNLRAAFLSPSSTMASGVGPMKSILQLRQTSLKCAVLRQKSVARMNRLHVADFRGADHAIDFEIAVRRLWPVRRNRPRRPTRDTASRGRPR